jgi:hypothetical protein
MDDAAIACKGKIIRNVTVDSDELRIEFDDCTLVLWDNGQSCCERRYMTCDDNLHYLEGQAFAGYRVENGPEIDDAAEVHQQQFLIVDAALVSITVANHYEHNGYYGGFSVAARVDPR